MASMRPSLTLSSGARRPAMSTEISPRLDGKGVSAAESDASASPVPRIETRLPGATPDCGVRLAALITPPGVNDGHFLDCPESPADLRGSLDSQLRYFGAH